MQIDRNTERLNAVKKTYPLLFPKKCMCCKNKFVREYMWKVNRWGVNKTVHEYNYCFKCTPSKEDVIHEIDTDVNLFGIACVDDFWGYPEKDKTKYINARDSMI